MTAVTLGLFERNIDMDVKCIEKAVHGTSYEPLGTVDDIDRDEANRFPTGSLADIISVCFGCNNAELLLKDDRCIVIGEPTEGALLCLAEKLSQKSYLETSILNTNKQEWDKEWERFTTLEFDRKRKSMSVLFSPKIIFNTDKDSISKEKTTLRLLVKGASNSLLERCSKVKLRNGEIVTLTSSLKEEIENAVSVLSGRPLRCLLLAIREFSYNNSSPTPFLDDFTDVSEVESDLTIVGVVGIKDPVREDVFESIGICKTAGIRVMMISGDAKETTSAIAQELNIISKEEKDTKVFTAHDFFSKSELNQLSLLTRGNLVFCRTEPIDKQNIVKMLQSTNEITAMTGDGVNDAPALRQASIGE